MNNQNATKVKKGILARCRAIKMLIVSSVLTITSLSMVIVGHCEEPVVLELNFDMEQMFTWAQMILDVMMPVIYITMGVALAFIIIRALKAAFS